MDLIAYALREEYAGTVEQQTDEGPVEVPAFTGGVIRAGERDVNIVEELEAGDGVIVVDVRDSSAAQHLDEYPALKRVAVPEGAEPSGSFAELPAYADRPVADLKADADARGIEGAGGRRKAEVIAALTEHDRRLAEGGLDEIGAPLTVDKLLAAIPADEAAADQGGAGETTDTDDAAPEGAGADGADGDRGEEG